MDDLGVSLFQETSIYLYIENHLQLEVHPSSLVQYDNHW